MKRNILFLLMFTFISCTDSTSVQENKMECLQPSDEQEVKIFLQKISKYIDEDKKEQVLQYMQANEGAYDILKDELDSKSYALYMQHKKDKYSEYKMSFEKTPDTQRCYRYILSHYEILNPDDSTTESEVYIDIRKKNNNLYISRVILAG